MNKKFLAVVTLAMSLNLALSHCSMAAPEKKTSKTIEVTGQDLATQNLYSDTAKTPEFQDKLSALKQATEKYKAAMVGRVPLLIKADEPALDAELQKNLAGNTPTNNISKKSKQPVLVSGFPAMWEGRWAGPALIERMDFSNALEKAQPQAVATATGSMHPGRLGYCELSFDANADSAKLQQYPQVMLKLGPEEAPFNPGARIGLPSFIDTAPARNAIVTSGGLKNSEQIFNRLTQLKPETIEQDLGERSITVQRGKQTSAEMRENIIYYSMVGPDQMYIYIAQINYLSNGDFKSKLLIHGVLKRKHDTA